MLTIGTLEGARAALAAHRGESASANRLGSGSTRYVYEVDGDPNVVYKVTNHPDSRWNPVEHLTFEAARRLGLGEFVPESTPWFVEGYVVLAVQRAERTGRGTEDEQLQSDIEQWFSDHAAGRWGRLFSNLTADLFYANCGIVEGRLVVLDAN